MTSTSLQFERFHNSKGHYSDDNLYEKPESDVTEILTSGGLAPSETSSRILIVVSLYSKDRIAINADGKIVSFSATNTLVSSEKKENKNSKICPVLKKSRNRGLGSNLETNFFVQTS